MNDKKIVIQTSPQAQKQASPIDEAMISFGALLPKLKTTLPPHITPEKFLSVTRIALLKNPRLLTLDRMSLINAALECSSDGLVPDGREAAFVEFKGKVKHIPMVFGLIKKMKQSGELATVAAPVIHENDPFKYWVDEDGEHVSFTPDLFSPARGQPIGVFAFAKSKDGDLTIEVLTRDQVMDIKKVSSAAKTDFSPWNGDFELEMWKKSAIRRLSKRMPMSTEAQKTMDRDDELFHGSIENKPKTKAEQLREKLNQQTLSLTPQDEAQAEFIEVESHPGISAKHEEFDPNFDQPELVK